MSPFYTKTGDDGTTGLLGNRRVEKSDLQIEVLGTLDELSASLGMARSLCISPEKEDIKTIQVRIYEIMSEVAATPENIDRFSKINDACLMSLEDLIERYTEITKIPNEFILPGDTSSSAAISVARTIARRAERRLVELGKREKDFRGILVQYLNRLSSFLYILELHVLQGQAGGDLSLAKKKEK
ncbi:MAG: cob(I)yrinic acid a,c-diamide adenosyltransferase [Anaerolineaceae bacterium]|nr:MAG: ATP:cob(I)alamin adenosyltransferase [Chloroflexi bacterium HGW-Chloroflexi-7]HCS38501.1 cob(I)yrinic acid a,c-diamide adenosyltransferase [Anaerolineaceae bacterium]